MHVLVTGAGGFIGHHLVSRLKADGYWVRGADIKEPEYTTTDGPFPAETPAHRNEMPRKRPHFLRRRSSLPCAVCRRPRPAMSDAEASASGWELAGAGALCPTCRQAGWQFPRGATVPFRAAGPRSRV